MKLRVTAGMRLASLLFFLLVVSGASIFAQTLTINTAGTWSDPGIWSAGNVADVITENASIAQNTGVITVGADFTIGTADMNNGNTLTVNSTFSLNVGQLSTPKNFIVGNTGTINVIGTLIIWGDLVISNTLDLNVAPGGILIVKGNVNLGNNGSLDISGSAVIGGNFSGGTGTAIVVNGNVAVGGTIDVGNGSTATGTGTVTAIGCQDGGSPNFCGVGPMQFLPIRLIYFNAELEDNGVSLKWATSKEENFDHFEVERASSNLNFIKIGEVPSAGYNTETLQKYSWLDTNPFAGQNYYRLKAVDLDASFEYFKIASVGSAPQARSFSIFPNPAQGNFVNYALNFDPRNDNTRIVILDSMGNVIQQTSVSSIEGQLVFDKTNPGLYFIRISSGSYEKTVRVTLR